MSGNRRKTQHTGDDANMDFSWGNQRRRSGILRKLPWQVMLAMLLMSLPLTYAMAFQTPAGVKDWVAALAQPAKSSAVVLPQPGVMVVTTDPTSQFDVRATMEPRGYAIYLERSASLGMAQLQANPGKFDVVVIDSSLAGSLEMTRRIEKTWPQKQIVVLEGPRQPVRLAQALLHLS